MPKEKKSTKEETGEKTLEHDAERLRTLHEIDLAILEARSLDAVSEAVLGNITQLLPKCEWACVALFDRAAEEAVVLAVRSDKFVTYNNNERLPLESFRVASNSLEETDAYIIGNLRDLENPTFSEKSLIERGMSSYMTIPLIAQSKVIGSFNLSSSEKNAYTEDCVDIACEISHSLAIAIENIRLIEAERSRNQELLAMTLVSAALRMAKKRAAISPIILDQLQRLFHADSALLAMHDAINHELEIELGLGYWSKATGRRISETEGVSGKVLATKRPYISNDIHKDSFLFLPNFIGKISAVAFIPLISQGKAIGALGIGRQTPVTADEVRLLVAIADMVANTIQNVTLMDDLQRSNTELARAYDATLEVSARALELRDNETEGHTQRVTDLTLKLARSMGVTSEDELVHIKRGAMLHDFGKIGISDSILLKPGPLTDDEWVIMREHPRFAYDKLSPIQFLRDSLDIPYCHHEKWDGSGYPRQLKGEQIPLFARIFAIVDVYDAVTSTERTYRASWSKEKALDYIQSERGQHFDPQVVDAFLRVIEAI